MLDGLSPISSSDTTSSTQECLRLRKRRIRSHERSLRDSVALFHQQIDGQCVEMNRLALVIESAKNRESQLRKENKDYVGQIRSLFNRNKQLENELSVLEKENSRLAQSNLMAMEDLNCVKLRLSHQEVELMQFRQALDRAEDGKALLAEELRLRGAELQDALDKARDFKEQVNLRDLELMQRTHSTGHERELAAQEQRQHDRIQATLAHELSEKNKQIQGQLAESQKLCTSVVELNAVNTSLKEQVAALSRELEKAKHEATVSLERLQRADACAATNAQERAGAEIAWKNAQADILASASRREALLLEKLEQTERHHSQSLSLATETYESETRRMVAATDQMLEEKEAQIRQLVDVNNQLSFELNTALNEVVHQRPAVELSRQDLSDTFRKLQIAKDELDAKNARILVLETQLHHAQDVVSKLTTELELQTKEKYFGNQYPTSDHLRGDHTPAKQFST
eukprot:gnl/Spiro4/22359_TR11011_c0_g1_i1.p1 gnl/Spiro4/22359_TR11011_c0_g1~~gnl/Spiro4/22359_TR11011_c0_g1_i1.p1  ORF type:complete len:459 (-),score=118.08 gnl/Spiro4/22359_TR11011_c0_g1_i1:132-1508(-)